MMDDLWKSCSISDAESLNTVPESQFSAKVTKRPAQPIPKKKKYLYDDNGDDLVSSEDEWAEMQSSATTTLL